MLDRFPRAGLKASGACDTTADTGITVWFARATTMTDAKPTATDRRTEWLEIERELRNEPWVPGGGTQ